MTKTARLTAASTSIALLTACASHEGTYAPACTAYAGDTIELENDRFVWDKFTDQVLINDAGEKLDPFPDYPIRGRYRIEGQTLFFAPDLADPLPEMYLHRQGDKHYIMTAEELAAWKESGKVRDCALVLGGRPE